MAAYPERLLVAGERVARHVRPHWRMLVLPAALPPVVAFLGAWLVALTRPTSWSVPVLVAVLVVGLGLVGWFSLAPVMRWRSTHFVVTDRRILVREGVLSRTGVAVVGASITAVRTTRTMSERFLGCGTLVVAVDDSREPWQFDGIGRIERVASEVERMARRRGGLRPDRWGAWRGDDDLDDDLDEDLDEDLEDWDDDWDVADDRDDEDLAEWDDGGGPLAAVPAPRRRRRLPFTRRRALPAAR
ncbi:PH domain-containing protein [Actinomycetospora sp. TBRC 11914]|uniref:PH domain-containing protein n=1 Tax=Actinomycetospora sp. TBRC 11914 TaxID=2729387 RepID=UPI00145C7628|nr:PH domain-containing protein [Actinomycetospora sp. TBRC 11914]NMO90811.1 PH domain-containing protein [Actinomycetospora sp. TBRC 11914]